MRIQNNVMAMNTHRMYSINNSKTQKSAEKLSSGYRINRAGDDAAGLAISEKMRSQVRGLNMASKNSQDAISLVQTAEGALQEVHSMLQRMNEIAVQSATGTNQELDRDQLNKEFNQLKQEINQISEQTTFNNMKILDGTLSNEGPQRSARTVGIFATTIQEGGKPATPAVFEFDIKGAAVSSSAGHYLVVDLRFTSRMLSLLCENPPMGYIDDVTLASIIAESCERNFVFNAEVFDGTKIRVTSIQPGPLPPILYKEGVTLSMHVGHDATLLSSPSDTTVKAVNGKAAVPPQTSTAIDFDPGNMQDGDSFSLKVGNDTLTAVWRNGMTKEEFIDDLTAGIPPEIASADASKLIIHGHVLTQAEIAAAFFPAPADKGSYGTMPIQVGALEKEQLNIEVKPMNSAGLGLDPADLSNQDDAGKAVTTVRNALDLVSDQRSLLGAMQNRLEHKISNLDNTGENLQSAESRIRDIDFAKEMTNYTKNGILGQASTSMLAQANASPQNVLSLLQ